jgi:hypothetical protein
MENQVLIPHNQSMHPTGMGGGAFSEINVTRAHAGG